MIRIRQATCGNACRKAVCVAACVAVSVAACVAASGALCTHTNTELCWKALRTHTKTE